MSGEIPIVNEVTIQKWVYGGEGLAKLDDGRVVLVPYTLPGERVRISASEQIHASLLEVIEPAPERVKPPCPLFATCGGCHYQHAPYEYQLARKAEILREQLQRVGKITYDGEIGIVSGEPLGYRNRAQFHIEGQLIGYRAARSHNLVPVEGDCPISSPRLNQELAAMRERLRDPQFPRFVRSIEIFTNESAVQINVIDSEKPVARRFYDWCGSEIGLEYQTADGVFHVSPKAFFQVNRFLIDPLVDAAIGDHRGDDALDLYSGVGLFAIPLATRFTSVTAVESGGAASFDLRTNATRAGAMIETQQARVEDYLARLETAPDFVLADPPRTGLGKSVVRDLRRLAPPKLTIVSCDPATLARDLAALEHYKIDSLTMVDLFPQTFHMETVAALSHRG